MLINSSTHKSIRSHRSWFILFKRQRFFSQVYTRPVNLPHLQILRIDGIRDDKWCHNDYGTWHHLWKKLHKKDVVGIITFDLINWLTSHQPHYCLYYLQWHTRVCEEMFDVNSKIAQTINAKYLKKFHSQKVDSTRNGKPWWLSTRFQTLTSRLGEMVQNL